MVLGCWRSLGCHGYLQDKASLLCYRPFHLLGTRSQAHLVDEFNQISDRKIGQKERNHDFEAKMFLGLLLWI